MSCRRVSSLLDALIDGELGGRDALQVRHHVLECDRCRTEYEAVLDLKRRVSSMPLVEPPDDLEERLVAALRSAPAEPAWRQVFSSWWTVSDHATRVRAAALFAAVSLILLALSIRFSLTNGPGSALDPRASTTMATAEPELPRDVEIRFAHETFDRPQPSAQPFLVAEPAPSAGASLEPLPPWNSYTPVSASR